MFLGRSFPWTVYTGDFSRSARESREQHHQIKRIIINKNYRGFGSDNDIGMIIRFDYSATMLISISQEEF